MIRVLWFFVILAFVAIGAAWLADRPGEVAMVWQGHRVETSVMVLALGVLAVIVVAVIGWSLLRLALRTPDMLGLATRGRRRSRGFTALSRGMVAVGSGDPALARRYAREAGKLLGREPMTLLLQAQAAQLAGDRPVAEAAFKAMLEQPETRLLGLRGLYVEARRKDDLPAAFELAGRAVRIDPAAGWANEAMLEHLGSQRRWGEALAMLERRLAAGRMDRALAQRQRAVLLTADAMERASVEPDAAMGELRKAVKLAPDLSPAVALLGRLLSQQGALRKATRVLEAGWKLSPHPDIAAAYIDLRSGDSALDRLERARNLQRLTPGHEEARVIVARTAIDAREFDRATKALEPLLGNRPSVRVCLMMAEIAESALEGAGKVREWLAKASRAPRDPAWIADGVVSEHWEPISPVTGRLDAFVWAAPTELLGAHPTGRATENVIADGDEAANAGYLEAPALASAGASVASGPVLAMEPAKRSAGVASRETSLKSPPSSSPTLAGAGAAPGVSSTVDAKPAASAPRDTADVKRVFPADAGGRVAEKAASPVVVAEGVRSSNGASEPGQPASARPRIAAVASEVVFPIARAPDDPGPDAEALGDEPVQMRRIDM